MRWLAFVSVGVVSVIVFVLFVVRLMPVRAPNVEPLVEPGSLTEPSVTYVNPSRGAGNAAVTIVEFSDFECPACKQMNTSIEVVLRTYPDAVRHVWKHMPNESAHPLALPSAIAAHCAYQQNAFWPYHDELFNRQTYLNEQQLLQIATDLALNTDAFTNCYNNQETLPVIQRDYQEGLGLGIVATPTIYVNNVQYVGALTTDQLISYVEQALAQK